MKKVGFLGGSFDPIHFGHISLAIQLMEAHQLDEVLFCPAFCSPFKTKTPPIESGQARLQILQKALEIASFQWTDIELQRKEISYTIDTIRAIQKKAIQLHLLLSEEAYQHFFQWKDAEELAQIAPPLVGKREHMISSTEVRKRLQKGLYCGHLIPAQALKYIQEHSLYARAY